MIFLKCKKLANSEARTTFCMADRQFVFFYWQKNLEEVLREIVISKERQAAEEKTASTEPECAQRWIKKIK